MINKDYMVFFIYLTIGASYGSCSSWMISSKYSSRIDDDLVDISWIMSGESTAHGLINKALRPGILSKAVRTSDHVSSV